MNTPSRGLLLIGVLALALFGLRGAACVDGESGAVRALELNGDALEPGQRPQTDELGVSLVSAESEPSLRAAVQEELAGFDLPDATERRVVDSVPVSLHVTSAESLAPGAATVGHVTFELHRAGAAHGAPPLFVGKTNAHGELVVKLDWEGVREPQAGSRPELIGRVTEPGFQQHFVRPEVYRSAENGCRLVLLATPGGTLRGRVTLASGRGVEASVGLHRWKTESSTSSLELLASATYLGSGYFEIHFAEDISGMLLASQAGFGSACLQDLHLDVERPRQDLRVVLQGPGSLRGHLKDSTGAPIEGHTLMAQLAALDGQGKGRALSLQYGAEQRVDGAGSLWHRVVTDENGWFQFEGLRMDRYVIRASEQAVSATMSLVLTERPVLADGIAMDLVLAKKETARTTLIKGR